MAHYEAKVLLAVAEGLLLTNDGRVARRQHRLGLDLVERDLLLSQPHAVRDTRAQFVLELVVLDDASLLDVDQEDLAGLEPALALDVGGVHRKHAHLAGEDDSLVLGDPVARWAQAVAVEHGPDDLAVAEGHRGRTIPRLHQRRVVPVEVTPVRAHGGRALPRLGNHHEHRVRQ